MPKNIKNLQRVLPKPAYEEQTINTSEKRNQKYSVLDLIKRDYQEDIMQQQRPRSKKKKISKAISVPVEEPRRLSILCELSPKESA